MNAVQNHSSGGRNVQPAAALLALGAAIVLLAGALVAVTDPWMLLLTLVALVAGVAALYKPDNVTLIVLFVIYSNAAVVAVKFHGVPYLVGSSVSLLLLVPIVRNLADRGLRVVIPAIVPLLLAFVIIQTLGTVTAVERDKAISSVTTMLLEGVVLYLLVVNAIRTPTMLRKALWSLVAAGAFMGSVVVYQQLSGTYDNEYYGFAQVSDAVFEGYAEAESDSDTQPRLAGPIGEKNRYAQVMAMLLPLAIVLSVSEPTLPLRLLAALALQIIAIGTAVTLSRGAAVGMVVVTVLMVAMGHLRPRHVALVAAAVIVASLVVPKYRTRIASLPRAAKLVSAKIGAGTEAPDGSMRGRATEMAAAVLMFVEHPIIGVGPDMYQYHYRHYAKKAGGRVQYGRRRAHSTYLGIAAEHGVAGLSLFATMIVVTLRSLVRTRRRWRHENHTVAAAASALLMALVMYLTTALFLDFAYVRYFWLIMALAAAAGSLTYAETRHHETTHDDDPYASDLRDLHPAGS